VQPTFGTLFYAMTGWSSRLGGPVQRSTSSLLINQFLLRGGLASQFLSGRVKALMIALLWPRYED